MSGKMIEFDGVQISEAALAAKGYTRSRPPIGTRWQFADATIWTIEKVKGVGGSMEQYSLRYTGPDGPEHNIHLFGERQAYRGPSLAGILNLRDLFNMVLEAEGVDNE